MLTFNLDEFNPEKIGTFLSRQYSIDCKEFLNNVKSIVNSIEEHPTYLEPYPYSMPNFILNECNGDVILTIDLLNCSPRFYRDFMKKFNKNPFEMISTLKSYKVELRKLTLYTNSLRSRLL